MRKIVLQSFIKLSLVSLLFLPLFSFAQFVVEEERETPSTFAKQGMDTLNVTIGAINISLGVLFLTSIIGLVVAGVRFVIAGGSESMLDSARKISLASIMGVIFSLVGYLLVNTIKHFII